MAQFWLPLTFLEVLLRQPLAVAVLSLYCFTYTCNYKLL